jgi:hypothetical protein
MSETSGRPGGSVGKSATRPRKPAQTRSIGLSQRGAATRRATAAKAQAPSPKRTSATGRSQPSGVYRWRLMTTSTGLRPEVAWRTTIAAKPTPSAVKPAVVSPLRVVAVSALSPRGA